MLPACLTAHPLHPLPRHSFSHCSFHAPFKMPIQYRLSAPTAVCRLGHGSSWPHTPPPVGPLSSFRSPWRRVGGPTPSRPILPSAKSTSAFPAIFTHPSTHHIEAHWTLRAAPARAHCALASRNDCGSGRRIGALFTRRDSHCIIWLRTARMPTHPLSHSGITVATTRSSSSLNSCQLQRNRRQEVRQVHSQAQSLPISLLRLELADKLCDALPDQRSAVRFEQVLQGKSKRSSVQCG